MVVLEDSFQLVAADQAADLESDGHSFVELALKDVERADLLAEELVSTVVDDASGSVSIFLNESEIPGSKAYTWCSSRSLTLDCGTSCV